MRAWIGRPGVGADEIRLELHPRLKLFFAESRSEHPGG